MNGGEGESNMEGKGERAGSVGTSGEMSFNASTSGGGGGNGGGGSGGNEVSGNGGLSSGVIDGWFPLYDTLGGVRGELGLSIKLNFIGDKNPCFNSLNN